MSVDTVLHRISPSTHIKKKKSVRKCPKNLRYKNNDGAERHNKCHVKMVLIQYCLWVYVAVMVSAGGLNDHRKRLLLLVNH